MKHYSVLKKEAIDGLNLRKNSIIVDATLGYAGHASEILKQIPNGFLYAFDSDMEAIKYSEEVLSSIGNNFKIIHSNFSFMKEKLEELGIDHVDGILFDLGVSSPQLDEDSRGFSFMRDGLLDMRMDQTNEFDAQWVVNEYSESQLTDIFYRYGEENRSRFIAKEIIKQRNISVIKTTLQLVEVIKCGVGANYFYKFHPERKIFQAIRIEVNKELNVLETVLPLAISLLNKNGRISVITFHSLEDRIVKTVFKKYSEIDAVFKGLPEIPYAYQPVIALINKKPILPNELESMENNRSKSAKLRIAERIKENEEKE